MRFLQTLASYVPGIIVEQLMHGESLRVPFRKQYETVCVFMTLVVSLCLRNGAHGQRCGGCQSEHQ